VVTLVGAGPGDPGLITVKGLEALRGADVVVFDRLVAAELVAQARAGAECIDVGKTPGRHTMPQAAINALLIDRARRGLAVVRLKGGDPFLFGRGGEEVQALDEAGIPNEVIPGVTSALAVPAAAGIPVTLRGISSSVSIVTGHAGAAVSREADTLVILMGVAQLAATTASLIAGGRSASTPAAVIESGTTTRQRVVTGTLKTIARRCADAEVRPPAVIVVGEVAAKADSSSMKERIA
jgi:uroporphyrin-III C-methyltransferase